MSKTFGDDVHRRARQQEVRGVNMPQIVKSRDRRVAFAASRMSTIGLRSPGPDARTPGR